MRPLFFFLTLFIFCFSVKSAPIDPQPDKKISVSSSQSEESEAISDEFDSGPYLIYYCLKKYYACVDEVGNTSCLKDREYSLKAYRSEFICTPVKQFATMAECRVQQEKLIDSTLPTKEICRHPRLRK